MVKIRFPSPSPLNVWQSLWLVESVAKCKLIYDQQIPHLEKIKNVFFNTKIFIFRWMVESGESFIDFRNQSLNPVSASLHELNLRFRKQTECQGIENVNEMKIWMLPCQRQRAAGEDCGRFYEPPAKDQSISIYISRDSTIHYWFSVTLLYFLLWFSLLWCHWICFHFQGVPSRTGSPRVSGI